MTKNVTVAPSENKLCKIHSDFWDDIGKIYNVVSYEKRQESTAIALTLEYNGSIIRKVVPIHEVEWL
jgi:hypothetical protein